MEKNRSSDPLPQEKHAVLDGASLLVADDDAVIRHLLTFFLQKMGALVHQAESWDQVLTWLRSAGETALPLDAVICDYHMPGAPEEALNAAVGLAEPPALILMTGAVPAGIRAQRFDAIVQKPFGLDQLLELLARSLTHRRAVQTRRFALRAPARVR